MNIIGILNRRAKELQKSSYPEIEEDKEIDIIAMFSNFIVVTVNYTNSNVTIKTDYTDNFQKAHELFVESKKIMSNKLSVHIYAIDKERNKKVMIQGVTSGLID